MRNAFWDNDDGSSTIQVIRKSGEEVLVIVDSQDIPLLQELSNTVMVDPFNGMYYAKTWLKSGERKYLHRVLIQPPDDLVVDHINRNPLDNRKANLRAVPRWVNNQNTGISITNNTGYKWVSYNKDTQKYRGRFTHKGKKHCAGFFADPEQAFRAVLKLRERIGALVEGGADLSK